MRLSSSVTSRTLFLLVSLFCCAGGASSHPLHNPPRRVAGRGQPLDEFAMRAFTGCRLIRSGLHSSGKPFTDHNHV